MAEVSHSGHRERVRQKFLTGGITEATSQHEILEMLLFYSVPRKNTNEMAHQLIDRFGSLAGVLEARPADLKKIDGIGDNSVALIKLILPIANIYFNTKNNDPKKFNSIDEIGNFLVTKYIGLCEEALSITCLDGTGKFVSFNIVERGDISSVGVSTRSIIELVLEKNVSCVIMAHNHPSGIALPSGADVEVTQTVKNALSHIGVKLIDHIIISDDDFVSMAQSAKYRDMF